jgi:hypothetical protein
MLSDTILKVTCIGALVAVLVLIDYLIPTKMCYYEPPVHYHNGRIVPMTSFGRWDFCRN